MNQTVLPIAPEDRTLAAITHLSGLSGYIVPLGGVLIPIIIWIVKRDSPIISSIAKQAVLLNVVVFLLVAGTVILWLTIVLIPVVILFWIVLAIAALALPIVGAIKAGFRAPELGLLGYIDEDKVSFYRATTKRHTLNSEFDIAGIKELPKVEIVYSYIQPSAVLMQALAGSGVQGIVFAGTGAGGLSSVEKAALAPILSLPAKSRPVLVRSTRVGNGRVIGSAVFDPMGMIPGDNLNPQKARILLMLALTKTADLNEIRRMFAEY